MADDNGNRRYVVEATDEYGSFDYDYFEDLRDARDCAHELALSELRPVIIVDRREQVVIEGWPLAK